MKHLHFLMLFLICASCKAQVDNLLVRQQAISDWDQYPIYPRLVNDVNKKNDWKPEFAYLDSIDVYGITYMSDGLQVTGYLAKPKKPGKYPCIIYNRGGNRDFGSMVVATAANRLGKLAKEGYVVIASQYRGNKGGEGQEEFGGAEVNDVLNLIDVLEEVKDADTENIGMYGWSRGGMMTYLALTRTDKIKAAVTGGGLADLTINDRPEMEQNVHAQLIPNYEDNKEAELIKRSAVHQVDKFPKKTPILMLHGNSDWRVKATQSLQLALKFEEYRIPYRLIIYDGDDHGITKHREEADAEVLEWFDRFLKKNEPTPIMNFHGK